MSQEEQYLTYEQLSEKLNIPKGSLYCLVSKGKIPFIRISQRMIRFKLSAIEKWVDGGIGRKFAKDSSNG